MECHIYEQFDVKNNYENIDNFLLGKLNQCNYKLNNIYTNIEKYSYKYIVCKNGSNEIIGVMPFIIYKNEIANIINSMPFIGYGGIVSRSDNKEDTFSCIIKYLEKVAKENNVSLITICTQPFKEDEYKIYKKIFKPDFERKNFYQYIDLRKDIFDEMKAKFRGNLRRNIKKCEGKYNVKIVESYELDDLSYWYDNVYTKRLKETGCAIYPYSVFETFLTKLDKKKIKMLYGIIEDKIIAGGMYLNQGVSVDNFMRVVDPEYFSTQVGTYLDFLSIRYALDEKVEYYNWQSCDEIGSSIFKYKEDWGSKISEHYYLTKVINNIDNLKKTPLKIIKENYKGIYVLPYEKFL